MFVVDSSWSICRSSRPCSDWSFIRNFMRDIVNQLTIGSDAVRVGLVRYGTSAQNIFTMNDRQVTSNYNGSAEREPGADVRTGRAARGPRRASGPALGMFEVFGRTGPPTFEGPPLWTLKIPYKLTCQFERL